VNRTGVIVGSTFEANPQLPASDRAALGIARSCDPAAQALCAAVDYFAAQYALAAGIANVKYVDHESDDLFFELLLVGGGGVDRIGNESVARLAEHHRATLVIDALDVTVHNHQIVILKDGGRGCREQWTVNGPVVIVVSEGARSPPYVSRYKRKMAALEHSRSQTGTIERLTNDAHWLPARPRVRVAQQGGALTSAADDRMSRAFGINDAAVHSTRGQIIQADPSTCARHLLRYLSHHGFLPQQSVGSDTLAIAADRNVTESAIVAELGRPVAAKTVGKDLGRAPRPCNRANTGSHRRPRRRND
jgi:electron transfer flavoprotein alpha/beta subunit